VEHDFAIYPLICTFKVQYSELVRRQSRMTLPMTKHEGPILIGIFLRKEPCDCLNKKKTSSRLIIVPPLLTKDVILWGWVFLFLSLVKMEGLLRNMWTFSPMAQSHLMERAGRRCKPSLVYFRRSGTRNSPRAFESVCWNMVLPSRSLNLSFDPVFAFLWTPTNTPV
jgi:hypothetical protein